MIVNNDLLIKYFYIEEIKIFLLLVCLIDLFVSFFYKGKGFLIRESLIINFN